MKNLVRFSFFIILLLLNVLSFRAFSQNEVKVCVGQSFKLKADIKDDLNTYLYLWTGPDKFTSTIKEPSIENSTKNNEGIYTLIYKDRSDTTKKKTVKIFVAFFELPTLKEISHTIAGSNIKILPITDNPNLTYLWTGPDGTTQTSQLFDLKDAKLTNIGVYTLKISDSKSGCSNEIKKEITTKNEATPEKETYENGLAESQGLMTGKNFLRLNLGTNFDYIAQNPLKLLYADASIMAPTVFKFSRKKWHTLERFGIYGRIYQFQGVSSPSDKDRDKLFFYSPNGENITGADSIIKKQGKDSLLISRPFYSRQADLIQVKNYGMAFGLTTPIAYDTKGTFYMSIGIHFEGQMTLYERQNTYKKIYTKEIAISEKDFLNKNQSSELDNLSRNTRFIGTIGLSMPIIWQFSAFELKILPAVSIWEYDDFREISSTVSNKKTNTSYSIHAVLTEIKDTGINFGCEIRGYTNATPTTFSIFAAKTINMKKFGEILKL